MKDRIKEIRLAIRNKPKVTQSEFAEMLGTSRPAIASYELGKVIPSDTFIQLICSKFHIAERWLRTGEGEMYDESAKTLLDELALQYHLTEKELALAKYCLEFSPEQRHQLMNFIEGLAAAINVENQKMAAERAAAHALLDQELDAREKDVSVSPSTGSEREA